VSRWLWSSARCLSRDSFDAATVFFVIDEWCPGLFNKSFSVGTTELKTNDLLDDNTKTSIRADDRIQVHKVQQRAGIRGWVLLYVLTFVSHAITSRSSRRKAPKNGTTGHSGIARARASARSYSEDRRAEERYSITGMRSITSGQNGFSLLDLKHNACIRD